MTPEAWLAAVTPEPLLVSRRPASTAEAPPALARRFRLFACACARTVWDLLPTDARSAVQAAERFSDGRATLTDLRAAAVREVLAYDSPPQRALVAAYAASTTRGASPNSWWPWGTLVTHTHAAACAAGALATRAVGPVGTDPRYSTRPVHNPVWEAAFAAARVAQAAYVRDIFPPPIYAPRLHPNWPTSTAVGIARQMDESGDFSPAPILADALQDAGCEDPAVLQCLRTPGEVHVRGNWVVDLILGRE